MDKKESLETFHHDVTLPDGTMVGTRRCNGQASLAFVRPLREGIPLAEDQELVTLSRSDDSACPRELQLESIGRVKGPAKFTTRAYRNNYDGIFGAKAPTAIQ